MFCQKTILGRKMQKVKLKCIDLSEILIARYRVSTSLIRCALYHGVFMIFAHRAKVQYIGQNMRAIVVRYYCVSALYSTLRFSNCWFFQIFDFRILDI